MWNKGQCQRDSVSLSRQAAAVHNTNHNIKQYQVKCRPVDAIACHSVYPPVPGYVIVTYECA